jgi:quercetin dioxygenase-like cupin family protein
VSDDPASFLLFDDIEWVDELAAPTVPAELREAAQSRGARRKRMATGQAGFFMNHNVMPAGFTVPVHSHDHDELIVVVAGGCTMAGDGAAGDGRALAANDAMVLRAGHRYGFTCGPEGMTFLTIRTAEAGTSVQAPAPD